MLDALRDVHSRRASTTDRLLRILIRQVNGARIEALALAGVPSHQLPDPIEIRLPGEEPPADATPKWVQQLRGMGGGA